MSTRTCKKCGWVYPSTQPGIKCKFCGEPFDEVICRSCGKLVSGKDRVAGLNLCRVCHNAEECRHMVKYRAKRNEQHAAAYKSWLDAIKKVPTNYPTLTEAQWMEACRFFNGCAQCGSGHIDARGFFISFEDGGRYCDWNIIPLCERCASDWKKVPNPFRIAWARDNANRAFNRRKCLARIIEYLGGKLHDAARDTDSTKESTE